MLTEKIDIVKKRYDEIYQMISNPEIIADQKKYIELNNEKEIIDKKIKIVNKNLKGLEKFKDAYFLSLTNIIFHEFIKR